MHRADPHSLRRWPRLLELDAREGTGAVVTSSRDGWLISTPKPPMAQLTGVVRDRSGRSPEQVRHTVRFSVSGTVSVRGRNLVVNLSGA